MTVPSIDNIGQMRGGLVNINLLGTISVTVCGNSHEIPASKVRTMLAMLALEAGHAISHMELADELWAGRLLGNMKNALQAHATRLRRVIDHSVTEPRGTVLRAVRNGYLLDIPPESVDANRFLDLAAKGSAALPGDPARAVELLEAGLRLWHGPALLDACDGLRCRSAATHFEERRLTVWEDLIDARLMLGKDRQAIADLQQLMAKNPMRERFCEQLMLALYRTGRQSDALELFHRTRQRLDDELGVQPCLPLRWRYTEILNHDPVLAHGAARPEPRSRAAM
jgi:DNA-binding SARP family transcriptional activator